MKRIRKINCMSLLGSGLITWLTYENRQLEFLNSYPHNEGNHTFTGGMFGESNTDVIQVYVSDYVKYYI